MTVISPDNIATLMLRYWRFIGPELTNDEREILLFAHTLENEVMGGGIFKNAKAKLAKLAAEQKEQKLNELGNVGE
jgi:hypothetical protein